MLSFKDGWYPNIYSNYKIGRVAWQKSSSSASWILLINNVLGNWDVHLGSNLKKPAGIRSAAIGAGAKRLPVIVCLSYYVTYYMIKRVSKLKKKQKNHPKKPNKMNVSTTKT